MFVKFCIFYLYSGENTRNVFTYNGTNIINKK